MRRLRLGERGSEITPQTLAPGLSALIIEFHCEEENSIKYKHATNQPTTAKNISHAIEKLNV